MSKISLTEHIHFFHIDKMTGLAWVVRADDSPKYISSKECNQCVIERSWGGFHRWTKSFFANQNVQSSYLEEIERCHLTKTEQDLWENESRRPCTEHQAPYPKNLAHLDIPKAYESVCTSNLAHKHYNKDVVINP